jgi:glycosyltransferase involved in cell wall biosynthesis
MLDTLLPDPPKPEAVGVVDRLGSNEPVTPARSTITFWVVNYEPRWEGVSKQVDLLRQSLGSEWKSRVIGLNANDRRIRIKESMGAAFGPLVRAAIPGSSRLFGAGGIQHLYASAGAPLLHGRLSGSDTLLTIAKGSSVSKYEQHLPSLRQFRYIVVETERDRELLRQLRIPEDRVRLILPGVEPREYRAASGRFTLLFASSPPKAHGLLSRGVHLIGAVAEDFPEVRFVLVWRDRNLAALRNLLGDPPPTNIEVRNGFIPDMGALYDEAHATILPGLNYTSLKPIPQSGLDSLTRGKPVLVSRACGLSEVVEREACGVVFTPTIADLRAGLRRLIGRYAEYRTKCQTVARETFSVRAFAEGYSRLYEQMI